MEPWLVASIIISSLLISLFTGVPIAFILTGLSCVLMLIFLGPGGLFMVIGQAYAQISGQILMAIPLFIIMAVVFQHSGIATQLFEAMHLWMGRLKGGLAIGTVIIGAIIAALSGVGATGTITMGLIAFPEMLKRKYNRPMVLGAITASGALGGIIPPSVLMIIVGSYAQLSVGGLFLAGVIPGLLITFAFCLYIGIKCIINPEAGPPLPLKERGTLIEKLKATKYVILPVALIFLIMGSIYTGVATPTEAAGLGALGAIIIAIAQRKLTITNIVDSSRASFMATCMIMWLLIGGASYSALITVTGTGDLVSEILASLPFGITGIVIAMLLITLIFGMFIDGIAITMICVPVFKPVVFQLGIDPFWFFVLFVIASVIGFITPPFGVNLFYIKGVIPKDIPMSEIYKGSIPYIFNNVFCAYHIYFVSLVY